MEKSENKEKNNQILSFGKSLEEDKNFIINQKLEHISKMETKIGDLYVTFGGILWGN